MSEQKDDRVPIADTAELATEWNIDNTPDLAEGRLVVDSTHTPYARKAVFETGDGSKQEKQLAYIYCEIGKRVLPTRLNQISMKGLNKAFKTTKISKWNNRKVVMVHQSIGDKTFLVIKARGEIS